MNKVIYIVVWLNHAAKAESTTYYNKRCALKAVDAIKANKLSISDVWLTTYEAFGQSNREIFSVKEG